MTRGTRHHPLRRWLRTLHRSFAEFLLVPTVVIAGFLLLATVTFAIDRGEPAWMAPWRTFLERHVLADREATRDLLATIAAGLITITSITISLLLIALQQSASALTHQVYDQFLRNWKNQVYFGVFVGLSIYALVTLASVRPLNPVVGASFALLFTIVALYLLLVLFYTTVDQMRPVVIIEAIHDHVLAARKAQLPLLRATRRTPRLSGSVSVPVAAVAHGFVTAIDVPAIRAAATAARRQTEVVLRVTLGAYVVHGQLLAEVRASGRDEALAVAAALEDAIARESTRDIASDPLDGIEELETIAWTSISSAQSDPDAGVLTIYSLRDILARWASAAQEAPDDASPLVYEDDVMARLVSALESLAVVASESMQHQSYAEILRTFVLLFDRLDAPLQARVEDVVLRSLSGLGDHILSAELAAVLDAMVAMLKAAGRHDTATAVASAKKQLARTIGKLAGRGTRVERQP